LGHEEAGGRSVIPQKVQLIRHPQHPSLYCPVIHNLPKRAAAPQCFVIPSTDYLKSSHGKLLTFERIFRVGFSPRVGRPGLRRRINHRRGKCGRLRPKPVHNGANEESACAGR
jgi:hypothetical protein